MAVVGWRRKQRDALYCRSYLVTLGVGFLAVAVIIPLFGESSRETYPLAVTFVTGALAVAGLGSVALGLLASDGRMEQWARLCSTHWASAVVMLLAYPVYLVWSGVRRPR